MNIQTKQDVLDILSLPEAVERLAQDTYMSETLKRSWLQMSRMLKKKGDKLPW